MAHAKAASLTPYLPRDEKYPFETRYQFVPDGDAYNFNRDVRTGLGREGSSNAGAVGDVGLAGGDAGVFPRFR